MGGELENPQFGPLPLARPASPVTPRLVGVESGALAQGEAPLMQTEAVMSIDDALRRAGQRHDRLGRGGDARQVGAQRIARVRYADPRIIVEQDRARQAERSEEHTPELQSLMRISYAALCLKKKKHQQAKTTQPIKQHT